MHLRLNDFIDLLLVVSLLRELADNRARPERQVLLAVAPRQLFSFQDLLALFQIFVLEHAWLSAQVRLK